MTSRVVTIADEKGVVAEFHPAQCNWDVESNGKVTIRLGSAITRPIERDPSPVADAGRNRLETPIEPVLGRFATTAERLEALEAVLTKVVHGFGRTHASHLSVLMKDNDSRALHDEAQSNVHTASGKGLEALAKRFGLARSFEGSAETDAELRYRILERYETGRRISGKSDPAFETPPNTIANERKNMEPLREFTPREHAFRCAHLARSEPELPI